jgi:dienelactone hydrolase
MRARAQAGLDVLRAHKLVDAKRIAAIGYCFGGTAVLELARSGADLSAVVSFHGNLTTPNPGDAKNIKGKILICQGGEDKFTLDGLPAFEKEMHDAGIDWEVDIYGRAVHSFTVPTAGHDRSTGMAYDRNADHRSWKAMQRLFEEAFKQD